jgi:hypothetical protein
VTPFRTTEQAAEILGYSVSWLHKQTRREAVPFRKLPHGRLCLFEEEPLRYWADTGCELERIDLPGGGKIIRPKGWT